MSNEVKRYTANVFFPGCLVPLRREVVLEDEYNALLAENDRLKSQVQTLQSDANSWQSGYDKGRKDGAVSGREDRDTLRAELQALKGGAVPEGYALVPVEPTPEMLQAGADEPLAGEADEDAPEDYRAVYKAMLAAAPQPAEKARQAERQEPVGTITVQHFRNNPAYENVELQLTADLCVGTHSIYTTPQPDQDVTGLVEPLSNVTESLRRFMRIFGQGEVRDGKSLDAADEALAAYRAQQQAQGGKS